WPARPGGVPAAGVLGAGAPRGARADGGALRGAGEAGDAGGVGGGLHNRLQPAAERLCPAVAALAERLGRCGAAGCLMSGSGTTLFALCRSHAEAARVARELSISARENLVSRAYVVRSLF